MIKRASLSNSNNPLEGFDKLWGDALKGSILLKNKLRTKVLCLQHVDRHKE